MSEIKFSKYQTAIFEWVRNGHGNAVVNAVAGSGKSFTIVKALDYIQGKALFLAFNKSIADELARKVPENVQASTLHSFGFAAIRKAYGRVRVVSSWQKFGPIMDQLGLVAGRSASWAEKSEMMDKRKGIESLISLVKNTLTDINDDAQIEHLCEHYGLNIDGSVLPTARAVFQKSLDNTNVIDYDDMIWLPVVKNLPVGKTDWVLIDETQDLNRSQIELALRAVKKTGRIIAVGDPKQSIYGFRGADVHAMQRVTEALDATELALSVCYRCPTSHIKLAQQYVPYIEAATGAKEGIVETINSDTFAERIVSEKAPLVLCRTNAPLTGYALSLLAKGIPCAIMGRSLKQGLVSLVKGLSGFSMADLETSLDEWESKELAKLYKKANPSVSQEELIRDKADTIRAIMADCTNKQCILGKIDKLFHEDAIKGAVQFSSVHRAKGLEADTVYILHPEKLPLKRKDQKPWEFEQECNITYVALTRSKDKLVFVNS